VTLTFNEAEVLHPPPLRLSLEHLVLLPLS
jgi:hypothetical protein